MSEVLFWYEWRRVWYKPWTWFKQPAMSVQRSHFFAKNIVARAGNIEVIADRHGMGFTCMIDGQPVRMLRAVTIKLRMNEANLVTIEMLPDHRKDQK